MFNGLGLKVEFRRFWGYENRYSLTIDPGHPAQESKPIPVLKRYAGRHWQLRVMSDQIPVFKGEVYVGVDANYAQGEGAFSQDVLDHQIIDVNELDVSTLEIKMVPKKETVPPIKS